MMRTAVSPLSLLRPRTLRDALTMLRDEGPLSPLAGCTDVYVGLQFGTLAEKRFIDLWPLRELRGIADDRGTVRIGALTTYTDLIHSTLVRRRVPMLVAASREIGGRQIQNRGTLGGNVANASPAGDSLPVLAVADATIVLVSAEGERRVPLASFYTGYRTSVRRPDEIIMAIEVPRIEGRQYWRKVGTRRAQAISKVMCAAVRGPEVRVALGSVGPTVLRLRRTERVLTAGSPLKQAQAVLRGEIAPIDDLRSTADYRREVSLNLLADFWHVTRKAY
jgi:xanthine dehydrogenase small subunit